MGRREEKRKREEDVQGERSEYCHCNSVPIIAFPLSLPDGANGTENGGREEG